jgi:hypothetical protein
MHLFICPAFHEIEKSLFKARKTLPFDTLAYFFNSHAYHGVRNPCPGQKKPTFLITLRIFSITQLSVR